MIVPKKYFYRTLLVENDFISHKNRNVVSQTHGGSGILGGS
jgi:hypothetical protein